MAVDLHDQSRQEAHDFSHGRNAVRVSTESNIGIECNTLYYMLLTLKMKLITTDDQYRLLVQTMERFNEACNFISDFAWKNKTFGKIGIQKVLYREIRDKFRLSAQMAVRAVGKVSESYKIDKKCKHLFDLHGAMVYDQRILTFKTLDTCSILTLQGRETVKLVYGNYQPLELKRIRGQADLVLVKGQFYLMTVVDLPEEPSYDPKQILGVDLGIVNLATTSNGETFSGKKCTEVRKKYAAIKAKLQSVCTWNAKKHLKKISGRERRFKRNENHCISKAIVSEAKDTQSGIALEDLKGIRDRVTVGKSVRDSIGKWAFYELASFIQYKAQRLGVPVIFVDPQNTSRQCSVCGYIDKDNRKTQSGFFCLKCGHIENADVNAARNISQRAAVNRPIALQPDPSGTWKGKPQTA